MDHNDLTNNDALPGLEPLVKRAVIDALKQHTVAMTADAIAHRIATEDLAPLVQRLVEHKLVDLARPPGPQYSTLPEWVEQWLIPLYRRSLNGHHRVWCPQWWRHRDAVARLDALWHAWEYLRLDPTTGESVWFRDHADHHMSILLDADGPLKGCDATHSKRPLEPLPHEPPPAGMFEPDDELMPWPPAEIPLAFSLRQQSRDEARLRRAP